MNEKKPIDASIRQKVVDNIAQSFVVTAPAGSGKTELLVQRVLALLGRCNNPQSILIITFTVKATAEMRHRIINALTLVADNNTEGMLPATIHYATKALQQSQKNGWNLLDNPHLFNVRTIDGLCYYLAERCPIEGQTVIPKQIVEDPTPIFKKTVRQLLSYPPKDIAKLLQQLLAFFHNDTNALEKLLISFLKDRLFVSTFLRTGSVPTQAEIIKNFNDHLDAIYQDCIEQLQQTVDFKQLAISWNYAKQHLTATKDNLPEFDLTDRTRIGIIIDSIVLTKGQLRQTVNKKQGFLAQSTETQQHKDWLQQRKQLEERHFQTIQTLPRTAIEHSVAIIEPLLQILPKLYARVENTLQTMQCIDFNSIALTAMQSLGSSDEPTDLLLKLDYQFEHILVDEFQDTSYFQLQLLQLLMSGWQQGDERTYFLVGDAMQSIYSFRQAEVKLFESVCNNGINDLPFEHCRLQTNFRSQPKIVDWVNDTFEGKATPSNAHQSQHSKTSVQLIEASSIADELDWICQTIQQLPDEVKHIAILVRARGQVPAIVAALRQHKLAFSANDTEPLKLQPCIMDIACLTRALYLQSDALAWIGLLRSPFIGVTSFELHQLLHNREQTTIWQWLKVKYQQLLTNPESIEQLKQVIPILDNALQSIGTQTVVEVVLDCWLHLQGDMLYPKDWQRKQVDDWLTLLEQYAPQYTIDDWSAFEEAVDAKYASEQAITTTDNDKDAERRIELMTIHKAKGLEFDCVFIPNCKNTAKPNDGDVLYRQIRDSNLKSKLLIAARTYNTSHSHFQWLQHLNKLSDDAELQRVFYVACTRAKQYLYLSLSPLSREYKNNRFYNFMPIDQIAVLEKSIEQQEPKNDTEDSLQQLIRIEQLPTQHCDKVSSNGTKDGDQPHDNRAIVLGNLMHRTLQYLIDHPLSNIKDLKLILEHLLHDLAYSGAIDSEQIMQIVRDAVTTTMNDPIGQWILSDSHSEQGCEQEHFIKTTNGYEKLIIDRTFIDNNIRWIIDYKTVECSSGQPLDPKKYLTRHKEKMLQYQSLFAKLNTPIKLALYFPIQGQFVEYK